MRILIVRHGDPDYEHDTLTKKGRKEAKLLAKKLKKEKIDYIYCSPLGRAKDTCAYTAKALKMQGKVVVKDWLEEFNLSVPPANKRAFMWDMLSDEWIDDVQMYDAKNWFRHTMYENCGLEEKLRFVIDGLDGLLLDHGYRRDGMVYKTEQGNHKTIVLFCHFGLEMVLLSHLFGISPIPLWHHCTALTTSVTTLYTEEREKGTAIFRMSGFSDTGHLYAKGEAPSFSARFCEVYEDDTRH